MEEMSYLRVLVDIFWCLLEVRAGLVEPRYSCIIVLRGSPHNQKILRLMRLVVNVLKNRLCYAEETIHRESL